MNAYSEVYELPNHVIPPMERHTRKTSTADLALFAFAAILATAVALGVWTFGLVALGLTAVIFVPIVMALIVLITIG
ncbi:hypothetical protein LAZ40_19455 [Cereibacter sphaeroides]|uniref:hypothetical protein n=1 Tax=Rhodobacterales TaxID=204455 RepID=UPI000BBE2887|nr:MULTISPECIES: hypothetical protein [Paracoccaceae]MCE6951897.1 hypothetical protein [Cereibacter sphaeroides]MCE6961209.1 hypothetical protein [Cereibacter sphaeroides]MCE6970195.1 hypothetical protein [Cereibacter sphaeroides]MCE6974066.1 hypothetical protein [Cereibacter sphaeroides]